MSAKLLPRVLLDPPSQLDAQATTMARGRYVRVAGGVFHTGLGEWAEFVRRGEEKARGAVDVCFAKGTRELLARCHWEGSWRS